MPRLMRISGPIQRISKSAPSLCADVRRVRVLLTKRFPVAEGNPSFVYLRMNLTALEVIAPSGRQVTGVPGKR